MQSAGEMSVGKDVVVLLEEEKIDNADFPSLRNFNVQLAEANKYHSDEVAERHHIHETVKKNRSFEVAIKDSQRGSLFDFQLA